MTERARGHRAGVAAGTGTGALSQRLSLDPRRPQRLDGHERALRLISGHVDLFAVAQAGERSVGRRIHLFRVESGGVLLGLPSAGNDAHGDGFSFLAVGGRGAEVFVLDRTAIDEIELIDGWIAALSGSMTDATADWEAGEARPGAALELQPGERLRAPARGVAWISVTQGEVRAMDSPCTWSADDPPLPLASGAWIEAIGGASLIAMTGGSLSPAALWPAIDRFHALARSCIARRADADAKAQSRRLDRRAGIVAAQAGQLFADLAAIIGQRHRIAEPGADLADPLFAACRMVGGALGATMVRPPGRQPGGRKYGDIVEIARASGLRARLTMLRLDWWRRNVGPLIAWCGDARRPVALMPAARHRYVMIDAESGARRTVDGRVAAELAPEAAMLYPSLPFRPLSPRDLLAHSFRHLRGDAARILSAGLAMGVLTLATPLLTEVLIDSAIPNSEIDQLAFCAAALAMAAIGAAAFQGLQSIATLRLEGSADRILLGGIVDRLLRLPVSFFRRYTAGDLTDRALGIETVRQLLSGRAVRGLWAGLFSAFSFVLMFYYDPRLALVAAGLAALRCAMIIGVGASRLRHERRHFEQQGKVQGLVLQFLTGVGKLRVAFGTMRALAVWARAFAAQKRHFIASQRAANLLTVVEAAFPTVATLIIFAAAGHGSPGEITSDTGRFLAFYVAFGQSLAAIGDLAIAVGESLIAIPSLARLRPLMVEAVETSDDRKPPGELSGALEMSQVTFRYVAGGPAVLNAVTIRVQKGDYLALVGPSGSGKSTIFRLLLGFEKPESGAIFFDDKALDTLDFGAVRRQIGVVLQNGKLASGSIYENICGGVQRPIEQAWEAARLAGLDADIEAMPMGMHTVISEGVSTLSGGQRQRLMIARALVHRPRILLFDEATSALDNRTQAIVGASLMRLNVTRIVIAHRLSTVQNADRIIVLADGEIVQSGTFEALSAVPGPFAEFARRQLL
jgi:NHLM bacteriocin system ABC transporter ATP-binding protein